MLLHMIAIPEDYLPKRSLSRDAQFYERREGLVQYLGYGLGIGTLLLMVYKIFVLLPFV